jgi:arginine deiminase
VSGYRDPRPAAPEVTSEVGRLRSVLVHRPGRELGRLTPRNSAGLLFDAVPWVERAQEEHDRFAATLAEAQVEVVYLLDLLREVLGDPAARRELIDATVDEPCLGRPLAAALSGYLTGLDPAQLADTLVAGLDRTELPAAEGLVHRLLDERAFVVSPLPNLLFTRDASAWIGPAVAVASPSMTVRRREALLVETVYRHHPRFAGAPVLYHRGEPGLEGGDVLLLAPGVLAVGVGQRTVPAAAELLAQRLFAAGLARIVLVVPIAQERATMHLDTVATMVDVDTVVMYPRLAAVLLAHPVTPDGSGGLSVGAARPFLAAAAEAMGLDRLSVVGTGLDPVVAEREQWDDGNNTLALAPRLAIAYERNAATNARLAEAGVTVLPVPGGELGSGRGGPRCMSCPIRRDPPDATPFGSRPAGP